jgi:hypothetical protein
LDPEGTERDPITHGLCLPASLQRRFGVYRSQDMATKAFIEVGMKQLDIVAMAINLQRAWQSKTSVDKGAFAFEESWKALVSFADAPPKIAVKCDYLWSLRLDVLVSMV